MDNTLKWMEKKGKIQWKKRETKNEKEKRKKEKDRNAKILLIDWFFSSAWFDWLNCNYVMANVINLIFFFASSSFSVFFLFQIDNEKTNQR